MICEHCGQERVYQCGGAGITVRFSRTRHDWGIGDDSNVYGVCENANGLKPIYGGPAWHRQIIGYEPQS